jgi:DNA replication protein DnaD
MRATWKDHQQDTKYGPINLKRGQFSTGRKAMAMKLHTTEDKIRTALSLLIHAQRITIKSTNKYSVITIKNYDKYQSDEKIPSTIPRALPSTFPTEEEVKTPRNIDIKEKEGNTCFSTLMTTFKKHEVVVTERNGKQIALVQARGSKLEPALFEAVCEGYCADEFIIKQGRSINGFLNCMDRMVDKIKKSDERFKPREVIRRSYT